MKLLFKQRIFSWFDSYDIYDEHKNILYTVQGKLALGHRLEIEDHTGRHVGTLQQRVLTVLPKFEIYIGDRMVGEVIKEFTLFKPSFRLSCNDWQVKGDFWEWNYEITSGSSLIAEIQTEFLHWSDTYSIDVKEERNCLLALMIVLAIDAVKCSQD